MTGALRSRPARRRLAALLAFLLLAGCGGGGGDDSTSTPATPVTTSGSTANLSVSDVQTIVAQAVGEAEAHGAKATIAVTDRVGNVLAVFRMNGALTTFTITDGRPVTAGLDNKGGLPDTLAAIAEAVTGAYLSSNGNAFTTRTAGQIIQENFNPGEVDQPSGPLFGVQFSSLPCSDLVGHLGTVGPQNSPLGLSASPGGLPLYKGGNLVGGIGVIADGRYTIDRDINDITPALNELIAVAGATNFAAPQAIRANMITAGGLSLRYVNSEAIASNPAAHAAFDKLAGSLVAVPGYFAGTLKAGVAYGSPASGVRADTGANADLGDYVLVDAANQPRFVARAGTDGLMSQAEVETILRQALLVAHHTRAQIRQPLNSVAQISIMVIDTTGTVLASARSADAPIFGLDVALQKARTALFFSSPGAAGLLAALAPPASLPASGYLSASRQFLGIPTAFADGTAYSARAIGDISRPFFPDGINGSQNGPLSLPFAEWSVFNDGLQLDLDFEGLSAELNGVAAACTALPQVANGIQIFPGSVPIYRGTTLVGAIGVSGDGVNQDDLVAFLGLANAAAALNTGLGNAPGSLRADRITVPGTGTSLLYVQCPQAPFVDTSEQGVCDGL